jgi:hypothetical protein
LAYSSIVVEASPPFSPSPKILQSTMLMSSDESAMNFAPFTTLFLANFRELREAEVQLPRMPQPVEKVVIGPVGSPKPHPNT